MIASRAAFVSGRRAQIVAPKRESFWILTIATASIQFAGRIWIEHSVRVGRRDTLQATVSRDQRRVGRHEGGRRAAGDRSNVRLNVEMEMPCCLMRAVHQIGNLAKLLS